MYRSSKGAKAGKAVTTTSTQVTVTPVEEVNKEEEAKEEEEEGEGEGEGEGEEEGEGVQPETVGPAESTMSAVLKKGLVARGAGRGRGGAKGKKPS